MKLALTERQLPILAFLKDTEGTKYTAYQIADTLGIDRKAINALINGMVKKGVCVREEATATGEDGKPVTVKNIVLVQGGKEYDHDACVAHDEAEAEAKKAEKAAERAAKKAAKDAE